MEWNLLLCNLTRFIQVQNDVISQIDIKEEINEKYANVLNDVGKMEGKLHLEVKDSVRPVQLPPRLALKPKVKDELCRLEKFSISQST